MIIIIWLLNFCISIFNAWGCGKSWTESKAAGGFPHLLNWCAAIMSAIGFTWCYMLIAGGLGCTIPFEHEVNHIKVTEPYFNEKDLSFLFDVGWSILIIPLIGSGLIITVNSWSAWWRNRTFGDGAVAAYNTFAMYENIYSAAINSGSIFDSIGNYKKSSDNDDKTTWIIIILIACFIGGILTTKWIVQSTQRATAFNRKFQYEFNR